MKRGDLKKILKEIHGNITVLQSNIEYDESEVQISGKSDLKKCNDELRIALKLKEKENEKLVGVIRGLREELRILKAKNRTGSEEVEQKCNTSFEGLYDRRIKKFL